MIQKLEHPQKAGDLLEGWQESMIWSCLQNVMGAVYADDPEKPSCAMAAIGDFRFLAGSPSRDLTAWQPSEGKAEFAIFVPQNEAWAEMIEKVYGEGAKRVIRYAIKKEPDVFDAKMLQEIVDALPLGYSIQLIDRAAYEDLRAEEWSRDLVSQYPDYESYERLGLGVIIRREGTVVSGASSYTRYGEGIEIEIDTREDFRRKGLARICGARLILECLRRNLYPSWDAQNPGSAALAEQLGYHFDFTYPAYEVTSAPIKRKE